MSAESVWIFQTGFVGDCVLTLPLVFEVAREFPDSKIVVVATGVGAALFEESKKRGLKSFSERFFVETLDKRSEHKSLFSSLRFVRQNLVTAYGQPQVVFCVQRSARSGLMALASRAPVRVGFSSGAASYFYTHQQRRDWDNGRSEIEKNLDLLRLVQLEGLRKSEALGPWSPASAPSMLASTQDSLKPFPSERPVLFSLGSPWATKRWDLSNAADLAYRLTRDGIEVHLVGDAAAKIQAQELKQKVPSLLLKDYCGQTSISEWIDQVSKARVLVSGDSAAVHVASDLGVPVVALFGPTLPEFGFAPWREGSLALGVRDLACRPCHIHGPAVCPMGHHRCMKDLSSDKVHSYLARFL